MSSSICGCGCCKRQPEHMQHEHIATSHRVFHVNLAVQTPKNQRSSAIFANETSGQTVHRLKGELAGMRQHEYDEKEAQQQTVAASATQHQHQMDDLKSGHDSEMAAMRQSNTISTVTFNKQIAAMGANTQQQMGQHVASHNARMEAMRSTKDGVEVKRNERVNVQNLANAQRINNMAQRQDAQCSNLKQRQLDDAQVHSQRMKMLSFSHVGMASSARMRNTLDMDAQRQGNRDKAHAQQSKVDAANERHHQSTDDEALRHGQEMDDMKTSNESRTAKHAVQMVRMQDKGKHKGADVNHMALHFVALENKLKKSEELCAEHERMLAENAQIIEQSRTRRSLLIAQGQVADEAAASIKKHSAESENQATSLKRIKFDSEEEEVRFLQRAIRSALNANVSFEEEATTWLDELCRLNERMRD